MKMRGGEEEAGEEKAGGGDGRRAVVRLGRK